MIEISFYDIREMTKYSVNVGKFGYLENKNKVYT